MVVRSTAQSVGSGLPRCPRPWPFFCIFSPCSPRNTPLAEIIQGLERDGEEGDWGSSANGLLCLGSGSLASAICHVTALARVARVGDSRDIVIRKCVLTWGFSHTRVGWEDAYKATFVCHKRRQSVFCFTRSRKVCKGIAFSSSIVGLGKATWENESAIEGGQL